MRALVFAVLLGASVASFSGLAVAQEEEQSQPEEDRASAFRAVSGPQVDRVPGGQLLVGAYGAAWILMLGYLWRLGRLHTANARELERLKTAKTDDD